MADVRCIFGQNYVASELSGGEPEGKIWNIVELEFCMNPAEMNREINLYLKMCSKCILLPTSDAIGLLQPLKVYF